MNDAAVDPRFVGRCAGSTRAFSDMLATALVLAGSLAVLIVGAWLTPSADGMGTHTQLGLGECGFFVATGLPCAACGMTTAVSHAARGHLIRAFVTQPAGALFALSMAMAVLVCAYSLVARVPLAPLARVLFRAKPMGVVAVIVVAAWIYKAVIAVGHH